MAKLLKEYHMRDACVVSSLKYDSLRKIKEADDSIETAYITSVSYGNLQIWNMRTVTVWNPLC